MDTRLSHKPLGYIIAGGRARRMGRVKHQIMIGGQSLLEHTATALAPHVRELVANLPRGVALEGYETVFEVEDGCKDGPLAALELGFAVTLRREYSHFLSVPVDMPFIPDCVFERLWAERMDEAPTVLLADGRLQGLVALWPLACHEAFLQAYRQLGIRAVRALHENLGSKAISVEEGDKLAFLNINTPEDAVEAQALYMRRKSIGV